MPHASAGSSTNISRITCNGVRDNGNRSGLAAIVLPYAGWAGGADPRREGIAAGF